MTSLRHYIGVLREDTLLDRLHKLLSDVKVQDFRLLSIEPHAKDGGVFVRFQYKTSGEDNASLNAILQELKQAATMHGGIPSWIGIPTGSIWLVKGRPWREVHISTCPKAPPYMFHESRTCIIMLLPSSKSPSRDPIFATRRCITS